MATGLKTVWVLGSGFSKSLGGPLLNELLGAKAQEETIEVFPQLGDRVLVYTLYRKHLGSLWQHAEDFLDYIDTALQPGSPRCKILERHIAATMNSMNWRGVTPTIKGLRDQAILTVAAECSTYTKNVDIRAEAWSPYRRWASQRGPWDTIITFNYDLVLEALMTHSGPVTEQSFVRPSRGPLGNSKSATVLKVHGSVNWGLELNDLNEPVKHLPDIVPDIEDFMKGAHRPLIATPGATKSNYCNKHLQTLWDAAVNALRAAELILFLGYRFPPSDSEARERLLRGIAENKNNHLEIGTVLGPRIHDEATVRLTGLLKHTVGSVGRDQLSSENSYHISNEPLYVEDFLSVLRAPTLIATAPGQ